MKKELGWKKGFSMEDISSLRLKLYEEFDRLQDEAKRTDPLLHKYLPKNFYAEKLYLSRITPWTLDYIRRLLTYRIKNERNIISHSRHH